IVHRDLKPANIKLTPEGKVKLLDFGLAKALEPEADVNNPLGVTQTSAGTRPGMLLGTPFYMSPEQARCHAVDKRTDIWLFGCVLYEILAGRRPFGGHPLTDTLTASLEREPDWNMLPSATPAGLRDLLLRCLRKESSRRLRDIGEARILLEELKK